MAGMSPWTAPEIWTVALLGATALFTGLYFVVTWRIFTHGRVLSGTKRPLKLIRFKSLGFIAPAYWDTKGFARSELRLAIVKVFNHSDVSQNCEIDFEASRLVTFRAKPEILAGKGLSTLAIVEPHRSEPIVYRLRSPQWTGRYRPYGGRRRSVRRYWLKVVLVLESGEELRRWRRVHLLDRAEMPTEIEEIATTPVMNAEVDGSWSIGLQLVPSVPAWLAASEGGRFFGWVPAEKERIEGDARWCHQAAPGIIDVGVMQADGQFFRPDRTPFFVVSGSVRLIVDVFKAQETEHPRLLGSIVVDVTFREDTVPIIDIIGTRAPPKASQR